VVHRTLTVATRRTAENGDLTCKSANP
jgi:hypothetical protein